MATGGVSLVPRALVIALGGVGRQIMVDVRRRICERFGGVEDRIPCQRYIYLDADATEIGRPEATLLDPDGVNLPSAQKRHLSVTGVRNLRENLANFPHLKEWLPESALTGDIVQGAGSIRARGRLALSWNIQEVRALVQSSWAEINAADVMTRVAEQSQGRAQFQEALPARVYLVLSLRGGTGSGIFIDLAYLLRKWLGTAEYRLIGLLVLPGEGDDYAENRCNAYAAIKELNHWNYPDTAFYAKYGPQSVIEEVGPTHDPPLNYAYLLEPVNLDGNFVDDRQLISMAAQSVFLDLVGEDTSAQQGAFRDNFDVYLLQPDMVGNPQHYLSLGVATIRFPKDRALSALSYTLASRVAFRLSHGSAEEEWNPGNLRRKAEDDLESNGLTLDGIVEQLKIAEQNRSILEDVRLGAEKVLDNLRSVTDAEDIAMQLKQLADDYEREKFGDVAIDIIPDRRNAADLAGYIRNIHEIYMQLRTSTSEQMARLVAGWANDPRLRLSLAIKVLDAAQEQLGREYSEAMDRYRQFAEAAETSAGAPKATAEQAAEASLQRVRQVCSSVPVLSLPWLPGSLLRDAMKRYLEARVDVMRSRIQRYLHEYAGAIFEKLTGQVRSLRDELQGLLSRMDALQQEWNHEADRATRSAAATFGKEVWDPERELGELFRRAVGDEEQTVRAVVVEVRSAQSLDDDFALTRQLATREEKVLHDLFAVCRDRFRSVVEDQDISERLMNLPTREQDVQQVIERQSLPYVRLRRDYPEWQDEPAKNTVLIGLSRACRREGDLMRLVEEKATRFDPNRGRIDVQDRTYLVVRQEICGFPIAATNIYELLAATHRRDSAGTPRYSRCDVEWRELTQPSNVSQFEAMKYLLAGWLGGLVEQTGSLDRQPPEIGFRFTYMRFGQPTVVETPKVPLVLAQTPRGSADQGLCYGPRERRMPRALAAVLQVAARNTEAIEALKAQVGERMQQSPTEFAVEVEKRAGELWARYPVLAQHFGPCHDSPEDRGPLRLALNALWEVYRLGRRHVAAGGTYTWDWSEEMRKMMG